MMFYSLEKRKKQNKIKTKQQQQQKLVVLARGKGGVLRNCSHAILEVAAKTENEPSQPGFVFPSSYSAMWVRMRVGRKLPDVKNSENSGTVQRSNEKNEL